jgi:hypothetical protein
LNYIPSPPKGYSATADYAQALARSKGIAVVPTAVALNLCIQQLGAYKILGPAFTSLQSVSLGSANFSSEDELVAALEDRCRRGSRFGLAVLEPIMTSTFMARRALTRLLINAHVKLDAARLAPCFVDRLNESELHEIRRAENVVDSFVVERSIGREGRDMDESNMLQHPDARSADSTVILTANPPKPYTIIMGNLEAKIAPELHPNLKTIPRAVFLMRREDWEKENVRAAVEEFCDDFNQCIGNVNNTNGPKDIPCLTLKRSNPIETLALQRFAETGFFGRHSFPWDEFACTLYIAESDLELWEHLTILSPERDKKYGEEYHQADMEGFRQCARRFVGSRPGAVIGVGDLDELFDTLGRWIKNQREETSKQEDLLAAFRSSYSLAPWKVK